MPSLINLRRKIKSITNTKQITKAMQMVAASKMRRAQEAALNTRAYASVGQEIMVRIQDYLARHEQELTHPLLDSRPAQTITLVVISSDKGLAGAYNSNVLRQTLQFLQENKDKKIRVVTIGRKIEEALHRLNITVELSFNDFAGRPVSNDIVPIAKATIDEFLAARTDQVSIIYTHYYSTLKQVAQTKQILPVQTMSNPDDNQQLLKTAPYLFEPEPTQVLNTVIPRLVEIQILQSLLDAIASEHSSRMIAMKNATDNAGDLIGDLQLTYNSIRQANITREIAEISAGANI